MWKFFSFHFDSIIDNLNAKKSPKNRNQTVNANKFLEKHPKILEIKELKPQGKTVIYSIQNKNLLKKRLGYI